VKESYVQGIRRLTYRCHDHEPTGVLTFHGYAVGESGHLYIHATLRDESAAEFAESLLNPCIENEALQGNDQLDTQNDELN
jgi:hypothetical protein